MSWSQKCVHKFPGHKCLATGFHDTTFLSQTPRNCTVLVFLSYIYYGTHYKRYNWPLPELWRYMTHEKYCSLWLCLVGTLQVLPEPETVLKSLHPRLSLFKLYFSTLSKRRLAPEQCKYIPPDQKAISFITWCLVGTLEPPLELEIVLESLHPR